MGDKSLLERNDWDLIHFWPCGRRYRAMSQADPGKDLWLDLPPWHEAVSFGSEEA